ncbi:efflux RND transporter periplasmic adaptor subunit [Prevotella falsenii]|uniref:efflux RND transporter periplasmic adaptor subunit n=1 Tax=Prevotella falsenii TaxID=515414 RepID=UPI0004694D2D|nr:efflux RND transporter periplasmic adaptor subunit [Prevotella falsenii]
MKVRYYVGVAAVLMLSACQQGKTSEATTSEQKTATIIVKAQPATLTLKYPAILRGEQDIAIYPQIEGKIVKVCVEEGQRVQQGQPLFVIDQVGYRASLATAQANVQAARAKVGDARLRLESKQQLKQQNVVSNFTVAQASYALKTAQAELAQAKAERNNAANNLSYTVVRSPSDGVIGTLPYKIGSLVSPTMTQPLTYVSDNARMIAYFSLNEQQLTSLFYQYGSKDKALKNMPEVQWEMSNSHVYEHRGKVATISGILDPQTGSVSVRAAFANENRLLISGATGNVLLPIKIERAIVIPQTAVSELQDKMIVYRMVNGQSKMTQIKVYPINDGKTYIVTEGLKAGDRIKKH